jgi:hypothetical protein
MGNHFQLVALPAERFASLFERSEEELRKMDARRMTADDKPGFPCRVSLVDAEVGETVVLVSFTHHDVSSPYRGSGPIFVRQHAKTVKLAVDEIPVMLRHRLLSLRGYDAAGMLMGAQIASGTEIESVIERLFRDERVRYLHVHNAAPGCYNCSVVRAS